MHMILDEINSIGRIGKYGQHTHWQNLHKKIKPKVCYSLLAKNTLFITIRESLTQILLCDLLWRLHETCNDKPIWSSPSWDNVATKKTTLNKAIITIFGVMMVLFGVVFFLLALIYLCHTYTDLWLV